MRTRGNAIAKIAIGLVILAITSPGHSQSPAGDDLSGVELPTPAIHATRLDYSEFDTPEAVTVITQQQIREAGYLEISEIFRAVPGFRIVKMGDESRVSYHGTTGRQNRRMLVTIDGRSALIADGQNVEFDRLPISLEDIARVTIMRGPNGAAYGDNAFLASIDFQTIGRDDPLGTSIRVGGGENARRRIGAFAHYQLAGFDLALSVASERDGGYPYMDAHKTPRDDGQDTDRVRLAIERDFSDSSHWRLDISGYDSEHKTGIPPLQFDGTQKNRGEFAALSNSREIGEESRLDWIATRNEQHETIRTSGCYTPPTIAGIRGAFADPTMVAQLLAPTVLVPRVLGTSLPDTCFYWDVGIESIRTALEVEFESRHGPWRYTLGASASDVDADSDELFDGQTQEQRSYRVFGETALAIGTLHTSVGAMLQDSSNVDDTQLAWRTALNWQFSPAHVVRYSYASSFRIPSLGETETHWRTDFFFGRRGEPLSTYQFSLSSPLTTSETRLEPERIRSHSVGYFGTFLKSTATVDIKIFRDRISDPVEANAALISAPPLNGRPFTLEGVEGEIGLSLSPRWRISGQYSYLHSDAPPFELGLQGDHGSSIAVTFRPTITHALTAAYYGNSAISGNSYDRYDLVYNYQRALGSVNFRSQMIFQHHVGGVDGFRRGVFLAPDEGHFENLNQLFLYVDLSF